MNDEGSIQLANGASLSITVRIGESCSLLFKSATAELKLESDLNLTMLKEDRKKLRESLESVCNVLSNGDPRPWPAVTEAFDLLHKRGKAILRHLIPDADELLEASELCRQALLPLPPKPGWDPDAREPRLTDVVTNVGYGIPFDMLPLVELNNPGTVSNYVELAEAAKSFLGFSSIVKRTIGENASEGRHIKIDNDPHLPMSMIWDAKLPAAKKAFKFFGEHDTHFHIVGGPWPIDAPSDPKAFVEELADVMWTPAKRYANGPRPIVCYFVCHCETDDRDAEDYLLHLGTGALWGSTRSVKLAALEDALRSRREVAGKGNTPKGPLIFLNTCGSGHLDPFAAASFPRLFTNKSLGYLGFIGTEATIPDSFASAFGENIYRQFVAGRKLGQALHKVRWHMLRRHRDPFGLMYTLYADPEIETRRKVSEMIENIELP